jgi:hypothetical protein
MQLIAMSTTIKCFQRGRSWQPQRRSTNDILQLRVFEYGDGLLVWDVLHMCDTTWLQLILMYTSQRGDLWSTRVRSIVKYGMCFCAMW